MYCPLRRVLSAKNLCEQLLSTCFWGQLCHTDSQEHIHILSGGRTAEVPGGRAQCLPHGLSFTEQHTEGSRLFWPAHSWHSFCLKSICSTVWTLKTTPRPSCVHHHHGEHSCGRILHSSLLASGQEALLVSNKYINYFLNQSLGLPPELGVHSVWPCF